MEINTLIADIATSFRVNLEIKMNEIGLHAGQVFLLLSLHTTEDVSQAELFKKLSLSAATVNKMVKSLEKNGFVTTRRCEKDTRIVRVSLTEKGREIKSLVEEKFAEMNSLLLQGFSETEKIMVQILLEKMRTNLQNLKTTLQASRKNQ